MHTHAHMHACTHTHTHAHRHTHTHAHKHIRIWQYIAASTDHYFSCLLSVDGCNMTCLCHCSLSRAFSPDVARSNTDHKDRKHRIIPISVELRPSGDSTNLGFVLPATQVHQHTVGVHSCPCIICTPCAIKCLFCNVLPVQRKCTLQHSDPVLCDAHRCNLCRYNMYFYS